jgi:hypothetical protein
MGDLETLNYRAIPYVLDVRAIEHDDGEWVCRVEYEELPDCVAEDPKILVALEKVDVLLDRCIHRAIAENRPLPAPRPPLRA